MVPPPEQFHRLIWQQAMYCWRRLPLGLHGFDLDDLYADGLMVYSRFRNHYDEGRGLKFITGFTRSLMNHYAGVLRTTYRRPTLAEWEERPGEATLDDIAVDHRPPSVLAELAGGIGEAFAARLSREAWLVVRAVLDPPMELVRFMEAHRGPGHNPRQLLWKWLGFDKTMKKRIEKEIAQVIAV